MQIKYSGKDFVGFDDIRHKNLYSRYNNLKKTKTELLKKGVNINNSNIYKDLFEKYNFYTRLNYKILELINLYRKENLTDRIEYLNKKYNENLEKLADDNRNHTRIGLALRIIWVSLFFREYFKFQFIIIKRNILNGFNKRKGIN